MIGSEAATAMLLVMSKRLGVGIALLADPTRPRIIAALALRPRRPSSLAAKIGLSRQAMSRQLRLLQEAGLIREFRFLLDGRVLLYRLEPRRHGQITAWLAGTDLVQVNKGHRDI